MVESFLAANWMEALFLHFPLLHIIIIVILSFWSEGVLVFDEEEAEEVEILL